VFPNEKREFSSGWQAAQKTEGRADGLRKRAGQAAEKSSALARPFPQPSLMCSPRVRLSVQPTGPSCSAACRPALSVQQAARGKFNFFIWQHGPSARPAPRPPFSVIP